MWSYAEATKGLGDFSYIVLPQIVQPEEEGRTLAVSFVEREETEVHAVANRPTDLVQRHFRLGAIANIIRKNVNLKN